MSARPRTFLPAVSTALWVASTCLTACAPAVPASYSLRPARDNPMVAGLDVAPASSRRDRVLAAIAAAESEIAEAMAGAGLCGVIAGIVVDGELVWHRSAGVADAATGARIDVDTLFRVGSITKTLTGLALLQLRDDGKVALDDPLTRYLPEAAHIHYPTADSAPMTVRELVAHASGLPRVGSPEALLKPDGSGATEAEVLAALPKTKVDSAPGLGGFDLYSNLGAALAGAVVAHASGQPYTEFVTQKILSPLGMMRSTYSIGERANVAVGHVRKDGTWSPSHAPSMGAFAAAGGLYSTLSDLARYVAFEISAWPPRDQPDEGPIRRSSVRESQLVSGFQRPGSQAIGVFWRLGSEFGASDLVDHNGGLVEGYVAELAFAPSRGLGVIALANSIDSRGSAPVERIARLILAKTLPVMSPPLAESARVAVAALVSLGSHWDEGVAKDLFSAEFKAHIELATIRRLLSSVVGSGPCTVEGILGSQDPVDWTVRLRCKDSPQDVHLRLGPDAAKSVGPGRDVIQFLTIKPVHDL